jgi:Fe-S cluster assembly iron-binding protein IscA
MIIDVTSKASEELTKVIESKQTDKPLRIYVAGYG